MGSGASRNTASNVTPILTISSKLTETKEQPVTHRPPSGISRRFSLRRRSSIKEGNSDSDASLIHVLQRKLEEQAEEAEKYKEEKKEIFQNMRALEKQLADSESINLDLDEQVQVLREHLEQQQLQINADNPECTNTLTIKDKQIEKLQLELSDTNTLVTRVKARFKKKIRQMRNEIAELQHESSLTHLETRAYIEKLQTENERLKEKLQYCQLSPDKKKSSLDDPIDIGKTQVILELSAKVNEQEDRIMFLEKEVTQLECSGNIKSVPQSPRTVRRSKSTPATPPGQRKLYKMKDKSAISQSESFDSHVSSPRDHSRALSPRVFDDSDDIGSTKALEHEIEKLRLRGKKIRGKSNHYREDQRESSGVSRDSGVMSNDLETSPQHCLINKTRFSGNHRPTSATSTLSNFSDIDSYSFSEETNLNDCKTYVIKDDTIDNDLCKIKSSNIRQISAHKKKKKRELVSEYEHVRELLKTPPDST